MEDLSDKGKDSFRRQLEWIAERDQAEIDRQKAERDAEQKQSDERARQFVEMLQEAEVPTTDLYGFDQIDRTKDQRGPGSMPPPKKVFIGRGWVIVPFEYYANNDDVDHPGLFLLEDGQSYNTTARSEINGEYVRGEMYLGGWGQTSGNQSARPENRVDSLERAPYSDANGGLNKLSRALARNTAAKE